MKYCENCCDFAKGLDKEALCEHVHSAKEKTGVFIAFLVEKARGFNVFDFAVLKLCLLSIGLWLGSTFFKFFRRFKGIIALSFVVSYIFLIWRIFFRDQD